MGSRLDIAKSQLDQVQATGQTHSINRIPRKPAPALLEVHGMKEQAAHQAGLPGAPVAVRLDDAIKEDGEKGERREVKPILIPATAPPLPLPQPKRLQPHFARPNLPLHSEFPLFRARKLQKVRLELFTFSSIVISAMVAFIVACAILYTHIPTWSSADVTIACYTVFLWNFAVPAIIACGLYVYMTLSLPRTSSSVASTPTSKSSAPPADKIGLAKVVNKLTSVGKLEKHEMLPISTSAGHPAQTQVPTMATKRTQPTFPRAASVISFGATTDTGKTERTDFETDSESIFVPPVPVLSLSRSGSRVKRWVDQDSRQAASPSLSVPVPAPPPSAASLAGSLKAKKKRSMGPVSQTQSWLDVDEE